MPIRRTYGCGECGHTWQFLHMTKGEPPQPCPECGSAPHQELSAPSVNRGDARPGITVPQSQSARETLAADLALRGTGMGNINSHMKAGDIAAKPIALPSMKDIPAEAQASLQEQVTPRFTNYGQGTDKYKGVNTGDPFGRRNMGLLGVINKTPGVASVSTRHYPTKRT